MAFNERIAIIGLGYVGLPLATEFAKKYKVVGYDVNMARIKELKRGIDRTKEISQKKLLLNKNLLFTNNSNHMKNSDFFILTVPTPITKNKKPDLSMIRKAAFDVAKVMKKGTTIILESTVYPGVTEDYLVPILEKQSKLKHKKDFFVAYSPERINPGETKYKLTNIKKIVGADDKTTLLKVSKIYKKIIKAGIHKVSSIKVAEASKAIENAQRDINIAFVNEVMMLSEALNINSYEVLEAARTKWNFLDFKPGLVGGHCIGVDPYYLAEAGKKANFNTKIILAGRNLNDSVPDYLLKNINRKLKKNSRILLLGLSFKEDVGDIRNSKSIELVIKIKKKNFAIDCYDPRVDQAELERKYNLKINKPKGKYDCVIVAVAHKEFIKMNERNILKLVKDNSYIIDIKGIWNKKISSKLKNYWCL
ncbi:nucleotide sugar dehydrogenase [Alphaproteobacteria bacterium]|nr:nucleotide sugar dehydrogenase [Alphaproteobacteria bacterium]